MGRFLQYTAKPLCPLCPLWLIVSVLFVAPASAQTLRQRMLAAEDARNAAAIAPLIEGLRSPDAALVVQAARGLGRFERPEFVQYLTPLFASTQVEVRREAVNAIAQSLAAAKREEPARSELGSATATLVARLKTDADPATRGAIAEALGRLPHRTAAAVSEVEQALQSMLATGDRRSPALLRGAARGLDFLIRGNPKVRTPDPRTGTLLRAVATQPGDPADADLAGVRRAAWLALLSATAIDVPLVSEGLDDPDWQVRRLAVAAAGTPQVSDQQRRPLLLEALADPVFNVRLQAVAVYGRTLRAQDCAPLVAALGDPNPHVSLAAIDALAGSCPAASSATARLTQIADALGRESWHRPAHALVALASSARESATSRLATFADHPTWEVRMYAARAAAVLAANARLERLAADAHDNVRHAAIVGLRQTRGHDADPIYVSALARRDYQLVLEAAQALEGSPNRELTVPALLASFGRISAERRDTSRDTRMALLARLRELGSPANASVLQPCLRDFDPVVAVECGVILKNWGGAGTGAATLPRTATAPREPLPTRARLVMRGTGVIEIELFPQDAPYTVERFSSLARRGYYNGLTFHRVVANFVLQGGSPGANEYSGDAAFMRDELGLRSNARGTLGTSTRGRDTGDAQFFVNLVDNPRLDHEFTVFGEIRSGLDVMDRVTEGDVIERVEIQ